MMSHKYVCVLLGLGVACREAPPRQDGDYTVPPEEVVDDGDEWAAARAGCTVMTTRERSSAPGVVVPLSEESFDEFGRSISFANLASSGEVTVHTRTNYLPDGRIDAVMMDFGGDGSTDMEDLYLYDDLARLAETHRSIVAPAIRCASVYFFDGDAAWPRKRVNDCPDEGGTTIWGRDGEGNWLSRVFEPADPTSFAEHWAATWSAQGRQRTEDLWWPDWPGGTRFHREFDWEGALMVAMHEDNDDDGVWDVTVQWTYDVEGRLLVREEDADFTAATITDSSTWDCP